MKLRKLMLRFHACKTACKLSFLHSQESHRLIRISLTSLIILTSTVVNRTLQSINGGELEITHMVPFRLLVEIIKQSKVVKTCNFANWKMP